MTDRRKCFRVSVACLGHHLRPIGVVSWSELGKQPDDRSICGGLNAITQGRGGDLVAAALEDARLSGDRLEEFSEAIVVVIVAGLHRSLSHPALIGLRNRPSEGVLGCGVAGEPLLDLLGIQLGEQHEHDRTLVTGLGRQPFYRRVGD
jgi:hypothetical protein